MTLSPEQIEELRRRVCQHTGIWDTDDMDVVFDLALAHVRGGSAIIRAAHLLGAEAMHYRSSEHKGQTRRYQQLVESMNAMYVLGGEPENTIPLPPTDEA